MNQRSSMLDLVRRTCEGAADMPDYEGVYEPDPEQVKEWQEQEAEEYGGELRFVNLGPMEVRRRLEACTDPGDRSALEIAEQYWMRAGGYASGMEAGSVFRGEGREAVRASSMSELAKNVSPVSHVVVMGGLRAGGIPEKGEPVEPGSYRDTGIIDRGHLLSQGPLPENEDWF